MSLFLTWCVVNCIMYKLLLLGKTGDYLRLFAPIFDISAIVHVSDACYIIKALLRSWPLPISAFRAFFNIMTTNCSSVMHLHPIIYLHNYGVMIMLLWLCHPSNSICCSLNANCVDRICFSNLLWHELHLMNGVLANGRDRHSHFIDAWLV